MKKVLYLTGSRADFGLMQLTLEELSTTPGVDLALCVTGAHLLEKYGNTIEDITRSGLKVCGKVNVDLDGSTGAAMAIATGREIIGISQVLEQEKPDLLLILGDRGEMLAGAIAAVHLNIPVCHIHGGERSGSVDELFRHAISKLSHYHFVATDSSKQRLNKMGEKAEHIFVTGAPGLVGLEASVVFEKEKLCSEMEFDPAGKIGLLIYHPVVQSAEQAGQQMEKVLEGIRLSGIQVLVLMPNSDAGGIRIEKILEHKNNISNISIVTHLERKKYISWMAAADVMIGNSSSGIIEAASLGLPVVNIGDRQKLREKSENTTNVDTSPLEIAAAIKTAVSAKKKKYHNVYGNGKAARNIVRSILELCLDQTVLHKVIPY